MNASENNRNNSHFTIIDGAEQRRIVTSFYSAPLFRTRQINSHSLTKKKKIYKSNANSYELRF